MFLSSLAPEVLWRKKKKGRAWLHMSTEKVQQMNKTSPAVQTSFNSSASPMCQTSLHRKHCSHWPGQEVGGGGGSRGGGRDIPEVCRTSPSSHGT